MTDTDIVEMLDGFLQAYPEDIFPTPPEHLQAKDAAAAHVMRRVALPWMEKARDEIVRLRGLVAEMRPLIVDCFNGQCDAEVSVGRQRAVLTKTKREFGERRAEGGRV